MSTEQNKQLSRRWFEEVWNQRKSETIDELFAADGIAHGLAPDGSGPRNGPPAFRTFWKQFCGAFPDLRITVEDVIAEGDQVMVRISFTGTHQGDHLGAAATGKTVTATGLILARWRNGQIVESWNEFDALGVFLATGVVKLA
jgi:predicted ester cyclase